MAISARWAKKFMTARLKELTHMAGEYICGIHPGAALEASIACGVACPECDSGSPDMRRRE